MIAAAGNGKNIFCEKPLAVDLSGAQRMNRAVKEAGVTAGVGLVLHYSPTYRFIRNKITLADAGTPIIVTLRDDQCFPIRGLHHSSWRADPSISGGGTLIEHSIHDLDLLSWLFGKPRVMDAVVNYRTKRGGIEDYARITMSFGNGMDGVLTSVWHDMVTRVSNRRIEIMYDRLFIATDHDSSVPSSIPREMPARWWSMGTRSFRLFLRNWGFQIRSLGRWTIRPSGRIPSRTTSSSRPFRSGPNMLPGSTKRSSPMSSWMRSIGGRADDIHGTFSRETGGGCSDRTDRLYGR